MAQICSSRFGNVSFFFKPNYHGNSAKREEVGRTRAFHRALAKIHSKKFKFYTKHLTLRVFKKMFYWVLVNIYISYLPKKVVCSVFTQVFHFFFFFLVFRRLSYKGE